MRQPIGKLFLISLISMLGLTGLPVQAKVFSPPGAGFSINMPGTPSATETTHKSFVGAVHETTYTYTGAGNIYTASVSDLPGAAVFWGGAGTILSKAKEGLLKECEGVETAFGDIMLGKYEGRSLKFNLPAGKKGQALLYLVEKKLYVIVGSGTAASAGAISRFLSSFKLTS